MALLHLRALLHRCENDPINERQELTVGGMEVICALLPLKITTENNTVYGCNSSVQVDKRCVEQKQTITITQS